MIDKAIEFATKVHEGQFRKGTSRPYIVHPIEVSDIVATMTEDEEIISAAVLHDTIEDCESVTAEVLEREFGPRVAGMVWRVRISLRPGKREKERRSGLSKRHPERFR